MKRKLKIFFIVLITIFVLIGGSFGVNFVRAEINYKHNVEAEETYSGFSIDGYINHQPNTNVFNYGFFKSDEKGCGWIATYNACKYLNKDVKIADIIKFYDRFGTNLFGYLGTNPFAIKWYFTYIGMNAKITLDQSKFNEIAKKSLVSIVAYFNTDSGHYNMIVYNNDETYNFYNYFEQKTMQQYLLENNNSIAKFLISIN
jgi:hypothetical protein